MRGNGLTAESYAIAGEVSSSHAGDALLVLREAGVAAYVVLGSDARVQVYADRDALALARAALRTLAEEPGTPTDTDEAWAQIIAGYAETAPDPLRRHASEDTDADRDDREDTSHGGGEADDTIHGHDAGDTRTEDPEDPTARPPADPRLGPPPRSVPPTGVPPDVPPITAGRSDLNSPASWEDEGHFVPPPPPPVPRGDLISRLAWGGLIGGPLLLLVATVFGWSLPTEVLMACLVGFVGGLVTLIVRMTDRRDDGDPGGGAVL